MSDPEMMALPETAVKQLPSPVGFKATYADFLESLTHDAATHFFWTSFYGVSQISQNATSSSVRFIGAEQTVSVAVGNPPLTLQKFMPSCPSAQTMAEQWLVSVPAFRR
jgi:hypothetical protein